jgi:predicted NBD/HSP70 family sugar kinase
LGLSYRSPAMALRRGTPGDWGTNLARVKDFNQVVVLDLIRTGGPIGRPAIAAATGLTLQTVSNIARRLVETGVVVETSVVGPGDGRQRRALRVDPDAGHAIGIQLVRSGISVGVVDLAGDVRGRAAGHVERDEDPAHVVDALPGLVERAVAEAGVPAERLLGVGVGAPGPLDLERGTMLDVLVPRSWRDFPLRDAVAGALELPVIMDNDATAAAMGERWRGAGAGADAVVYVYLGTGVGAGIVLGGQPHRGRRGNAGEISHIQVDPAGPPCDCGARGCVGLYPTPDGLLREARRVELEAPPAAPIGPAPGTLEALAATDEPRYAAVVQRAGTLLGRVVRDLSRALDPDVVVLGGPLVPTVGRAFAAAVTAALDEPGSAAGPPRVELSRIGSDAGVIGAATLVLHDLYAPTAHKLSLAEPPAMEDERPAA